ncbi:MAG: C4-type zinc ribbon domain-containing protein [Actinobacteria bacterium]|nr:C4-type zinc ribbon domain-containing protein [Actinomycetota bacterium]
MNAEPAVQLRLLDLQALDVRLDQIEHRRRTLPQLAQIAELEGRVNAVRDRVVAAETEVSDLERAMAKAETDVEQVRARARKDQELLDSGRIGSAKELENLQREIESLARRQGDLEDAELEVMEKLEDARSALASLTAERDAVAADLDRLAAERDAALADADKDAGWVRQERAVVVPDIPADLIALYDRLRADHGGVGAAALHQRRCEGCRMELTPTDLVRIRDAAPDALLRCEECRRILVRTPESGL